MVLLRRNTCFGKQNLTCLCERPSAQQQVRLGTVLESGAPLGSRCPRLTYAQNPFVPLCGLALPGTRSEKHARQELHEHRTGPVTGPRAALEDLVPKARKPCEDTAQEKRSLSGPFSSVTNLATDEKPGLRWKYLQFEQAFVHGHQPSSWKESGAEYLRGVGTRPAVGPLGVMLVLHQSLD